MKRLLLVLFLLTFAASLEGQEPRAQWFRGNTHTHTLNSDGDSTPAEVVAWYREHGYHFVVITDHNYLTEVDGLNALHAAKDKFLVIRGEEVSDSFGKVPIHVNGLEVKELVEPQGGTSVLDTVQRNVDAIRRAAGVPHINHPNFGWAISPEDLEAVENNRLFEIFNGHPQVNNQGGGERPSLEQTWDAILTSGRLVYGIAVDDAHHFKRPWDPDASKPGQGWIWVRARALTSKAILDALEKGEFYASTGVELASLSRSARAIEIEVRQVRDERYRTTFIGAGGRVLATSSANPARYEIRGDEGYVRARVESSNGKVAWVQPVTVGDGR